MSLVKKLQPINLTEEKQKFFAKDCYYNPYFQYQALITKNILLKYGLPKAKYTSLAQNILQRTFSQYSETQIRKMEGVKLNQKQAKQMVQAFLQKNKLEKEFKIRWIKNNLSKASFYKNILKLRIPIWHREHEFQGMLYHELGTHGLRRINYAQQPFFKKKKNYGFSDYLPTEEGLASLHTLLATNLKLYYKGALNYLVCSVAQENSFIKTFEFVSQYIKDQNRAWDYTIKHKRGLYDTSKPGGFTKDKIYFEGAIQVWQHLNRHQYDIEPFYWGKIALKDLDKAQQLNPDFKPKLPHFYTENKEKYQEKIFEIGQINQFDQI